MTALPFDLAGLVRAAGRDLYPSWRPRDLYRRFRFWRAANQHAATLQKLLTLDVKGSFAKALRRRPRVLGMFLWPYINTEWGVEQRLEKFAGHYWCAEAHPRLDLDVDQRAILVDLGDVRPGLQLVIDRPQWFLREGELSINLFLDDQRIYSIAFSLGRVAGIDVAYVGCIQGRNIEGIDRLYKELTKQLHGARPRDFLISSFQLLCEAENIVRILAVSDAARHHRHDYFGGKVDRTQSANYDVIWSDRGGRPQEPGFYELPGRLTFKTECDIPSAKRAQYRHRYALYGRVRQTLAEHRAPASTQLVHVDDTC